MTDDIFKIVVSAVLVGATGIIVSMLAFILTGFRSDIQNVQTGLKALEAEVHRNYVELSSKLDQLGKCRRW